MVPADSASTSASVRYVQWSADAASEFDRQLDAGAESELVGVQAGTQPCLRGGGEDRPALVGVERPDLTERVGERAVRRRRREHLAAHQRHVVVGAAGELGRHDVRPEQRGVRRRRGGDFEQSRLVGDREAVARLDLDRSDPVAARLADPAVQPCVQLGGRRRPGGGHRGGDATRGVRRTRHARHELVTAIACEHEVGVAVDEAGDHAPSTRVAALVGGHTGRLDRHDGRSVDDQRHVAQQSEWPVTARSDRS